jgi:PAS domain S-box-containing protein
VFNRRIAGRVSAALSILLTNIAVAQQKDVLVLEQTPGTPGANALISAIEAKLRSSPGGVEIFIEAFDPVAFPEAGQEATLASFFREKYSNRAIDLTIAIGPAPLSFLASHGEELFPEAPLVFGAVRQSSVPSEELLPNAQGVVSGFDLVGTLDLALALQPDARRVAIITGASLLDVSWNALARERLTAYADRLDVTYFEGVPIADLQEELAALPRDSIVVFLTMLTDRAGERFARTADLVARISAASSAPLYGVYDYSVGDGIVGGYVEPMESIGADIGRLALEILAGERGDTPPTRIAAKPQFVVDARQMNRWGLDESRLPPGTVVKFREPSLWDQYRGLILGAAAFMVFQTMLIILLVLRARERRIEHALEATEDRYRNVVETQTDLICRYLPDTTLTFVNDAYCRYFGCSRDTLVGKKFVDLLPDSERDAAVQRIESLLADPRIETNVRRVLKADGSLGWQEWLDHVIVDADRRGPIEIQGIGRDITDLRRAEAEAQQRREEVTHLTRVTILGEFAGALAHELNQPLTAILSNAQAAQMLMARDEIDQDEVREILSDIVTDDVRAGEVIKRLRDLLKRGKSDVQLLDINALVGDVLALAHAQLVAHHVQMASRLDADVRRSRGDRVQLQQVLLNLLMNACEAMAATEPAERMLSISTSDRDGFISVTVVDSGSGLAPEVADRLFEPFVTTKAKGLGLGLSICRSIVAAHGGHLSATNNADRGASFVLRLPAEADAVERRGRAN